jgi:DNA primase large subunit
VPFTHVLSLVAAKQITLRDGLGNLRCDQVVVYLGEIFSKFVSYNSFKLQQLETFEKIKDDPRCSELLQRLRLMFEIALPPKIRVQSLVALTLNNLDTVSQYFPPCMRALHLTLRQRHRLCHRPRVQYTLFLKEIGLHVDDCIQLIKTEYSLPARQVGQRNHACEHSWHTDSRRYKYGTRHLYGLEGGRKNYSAHTCQSIQVILFSKTFLIFFLFQGLF